MPKRASMSAESAVTQARYESNRNGSQLQERMERERRARSRVERGVRDAYEGQLLHRRWRSPVLNDQADWTS